MRILIEVMTNTRTRMYAFDLFYHWPFVTFENLTKKSIEEK